MVIVLNHPVTVKNRAKVTHGRFHFFHPTHGQIIQTAIIEQGCDFAFQEIINIPAFHLILQVKIIIGLAPANGPSVTLVIAFLPPSIQGAQVQNPIGNGLHAAGTARFERPARGVEP